MKSVITPRKASSDLHLPDDRIRLRQRVDLLNAMHGYEPTQSDRGEPDFIQHLHLPERPDSDRMLIATKRDYTGVGYKSSVRKLRGIGQLLDINISESRYNSLCGKLHPHDRPVTARGSRLGLAQH